MGGILSSPEENRSKVVLVPPLFERQHVDVERFTRSPFSPESDFFHQTQLQRLFENYLKTGFHSKVALSSKQNPNSTFVARFTTPEDLQSLHGKSLALQTLLTSGDF